MQLSVVLFAIYKHHKKLSEVLGMHTGIRRHNAAQCDYADADSMATD